MPKVAVFNTEGQQVGEMELNENIFGAKINEPVLHQAVQVYLANQRQGTQSAKTRAEVRGGGRKPWRQKGTGRARQGSIRSPQWTGGGVVFAPKPRDYSQKLPKKMRRLAMVSALSSKVENNEIIVLDSITMETPKTKFIADMLKKLNAGRKALIVLKGKDEVVERSANNIEGVKTTLVNTLNVYDILKYDTFVITREAVEAVEEVYA
ncbi:MAG: LSU ribosomal protein L4p (L1e) [Firmicutes bacterium]|nr:LSU ribosomal protein L4p (L1e) [Bacillota bacterium]MDI6705883.1 50S ribosomal protein L4 [Bacillota bacterium]